MKITEAKLKQIIKEEVVKLLTENEDQEKNQYQQYATKILELLDHKQPDSSPDTGTFAQGVALYSALKDDIEANAPAKNVQILKKLKVIKQFAYSNIEHVDFLSGLSELNVTKQIILTYCRSLENIGGLEGCTNLKTLYLGGCESLQNIDVLQGLTNLTTLNLSYCKLLQNIGVLEGCTKLTSLVLAGCESLQNIDGLQTHSRLTRVDLYSCESLQNVDGLVGCTKLANLDLRGCSSLPPELQRWFKTDEYGTAYNHFMKALNAS